MQGGTEAPSGSLDELGEAWALMQGGIEVVQKAEDRGMLQTSRIGRI